MGITDNKNIKPTKKPIKGHDKGLFVSAKSLAKDHQKIVENLSDTGGEAQITVPSDVPGGVFGASESTTRSTEEAWERKIIGRDIRQDKQRKAGDKYGR